MMVRLIWINKRKERSQRARRLAFYCENAYDTSGGFQTSAFAA